MLEPPPRSDLAQALLARRTILLSGAVDSPRAGDAVAALLTLDALGDEPIELRLNAESDSLEAAFSLMDTIDAMGVTVNATVASTVGGTMVGVLAVCGRRRMGRAGRIHLREPSTEVAGPALVVGRQAADFERQVEAFVRRLSEATARPFEHVEAELRVGAHLGPEEALAFGLVDELTG
jgi:ATP-dependent Clp protease protease subunit